MAADFLLGVAISAHQVNGDITGDDWAGFTRQPGVTAEGAGSGRAAEHWNRLEEDPKLFCALGANAYRLSQERPWLKPHPKFWDHVARKITARGLFY
ncbi:MAG: family 1 glycosylhydrolase [Cyanobium sp.]